MKKKVLSVLFAATLTVATLQYSLSEISDVRSGWLDPNFLLYADKDMEVAVANDS